MAVPACRFRNDLRSATGGADMLIRLLCLAAVTAFSPLASAQTGETTTRQVHIISSGDGPAAQTLDLPMSQAAIIHLPIDAADVLVTNPAIADAVIRTPRRAYLLGLTTGSTNAFFFDANGDLILDLQIRVDRDVRALQDTIDRFLPDSRITAEAMNNNIVLSGSAPDAASADSARRLAQQWVENPENVLSMIAIEGRQQVMLRVRIVEMQRTFPDGAEHIRRTMSSDSASMGHASEARPISPRSRRTLGRSRPASSALSPDLR